MSCKTNYTVNAYEINTSEVVKGGIYDTHEEAMIYYNKWKHDPEHGRVVLYKHERNAKTQKRKFKEPNTIIVVIWDIEKNRNGE